MHNLVETERWYPTTDSSLYGPSRRMWIRHWNFGTSSQASSGESRDYIPGPGRSHKSSSKSILSCVVGSCFQQFTRVDNISTEYCIVTWVCSLQYSFSGKEINTQGHSQESESIYRSPWTSERLSLKGAHRSHEIRIIHHDSKSCFVAYQHYCLTIRYDRSEGKRTRAPTVCQLLFGVTKGTSNSAGKIGSWNGEAWCHGPGNPSMAWDRCIMCHNCHTWRRTIWIFKLPDRIHWHYSKGVGCSVGYNERKSERTVHNTFPDWPESVDGKVAFKPP